MYRRKHNLKEAHNILLPKKGIHPTFADLTHTSPNNIDISLNNQSENSPGEPNTDNRIPRNESNFGNVTGAIECALEFDSTSPTKKRRGSKLFSSKGCDEIILEQVENMSILDAREYFKQVSSQHYP